MVVKDHIVYRIIPFDAEVKVGDRALPSKWKALGNYKKRQEETLEKHRPNGLPRRHNCLYVCFSKENAYEWARIKYCKRNTCYKLLTLELTGELCWLKADCYNFLNECSTQQDFDNEAIRYWESLIEDKSLLSLDNGYEGLFVGDAVVKAIEYKNYINGESMDVE